MTTKAITQVIEFITKANTFANIGPIFASIFKFAFTPAAFIGGGIGVLIKKTMDDE